MACIDPIVKKKSLTLRHIDDYATDLIPCGNCYQCKRSRSNEWFVRVNYELKRSESAHFITLTYANPPLSKNGHFTGVKEELQDFFKRMRYYDSEVVRNPKTGRKKRYYNTAISYYAVLEYGTKYQRPHYHILLFGIKNIRSVFRAWENNGKPIGSIDVGEVEQASINYVVSYVGKKIGIGKDDHDDRLPEFAIMSKGIGSNYLDNAANFHRSNETSYLVLDGITYKLPRYYKNKIWKPYKASCKDNLGIVHSRMVQHPAARRIGKKNLIRYFEQLERQKILDSNYESNIAHYNHLMNNYSPSKNYALS